ncbi:type II toxin-antitoxin system PemK/MazF family toxin [Methylotuvimicrobium sp. KM1]|uniref:type II toxin-antitoxin system PemK/MazF family toxin n=1 Tax=Methylotuvimicrobium sp. KM1 TaxID=3377707 RepID=UPI0038508703
MGAFAVGQVVILPFPFSDLSHQKYRPALLLAEAGKDDWIACQITSNRYADPLAIEINADDFSKGSLQRLSYARPGKIFTAHRSLFSRVVGQLSDNKVQHVRLAVITLLNGD